MNNICRQFTLDILRRKARAFAGILGTASLAIALPAAGQFTGTFIDRTAPTDLRIVSYNVEFDTIFVDAVNGPEQAPKIARIIQALQPDVLNLQEIYNHSAAQVVTLMNSIVPLPDSETWYAAGGGGGGNYVVSKYPLSLTRSTTNPNPPSTNYGIALVNLPDQQFPADFYFMDAHFKCCGNPGGSEDIQRQRQADALVNWMRDARTLGESVNLPTGTPMAVVGDLNIVGSQDPLNNLISGNVFDNATYGPDSPPDWDGASLADAHPLHNVTGPDDYTWRDDASIYDPGRLDYVLYTDSVVNVAKKFVLDTVPMSAADLAATGLQQFDVPNSPGRYDHLPLVVDFRFPLPGDYNSDGVVDSLDYTKWMAAFGTTNTAADGNHDGVVNAADYAVWRHYLSGGGTGADGAGAATTVPERSGIASLILAVVWVTLIATVPRRPPATAGLRFAV